MSVFSQDLKLDPGMFWVRSNDKVNEFSSYGFVAPGAVYATCSHGYTIVPKKPMPEQNRRYFADILNAFSWMRAFEYQLRFHRNMFLDV